jgi:hypothetical protein
VEEHHWLFIHDQRENLRYVYAITAARNTTDLDQVLHVGSAPDSVCMCPFCKTEPYCWCLLLGNRRNDISSCASTLLLTVSGLGLQMLFGIKSKFKYHRAEQMDALQVRLPNSLENVIRDRFFCAAKSHMVPVSNVIEQYPQHEGPQLLYFLVGTAPGSGQRCWRLCGMGVSGQRVGDAHLRARLEVCTQSSCSE